MKKKIVVLTGAGISKESGISTFRDSNGLWEGHDIVEVASLEGFGRRPERVHKFYNARRAQLFEVEPNAAHYALAELEASSQYEVVIITQNVDDLHEKGGSQQVLHMHGQLNSALCAACETRWPVASDMKVGAPCPKCIAPAARPDIVWFGEMPHRMEEIWAALRGADLFVSIGTSGNVYPAAAFAQDADRAGVDTLELNLEPSEGATDFAAARYGPATAIVPEWVDEMLGA